MRTAGFVLAALGVLFVYLAWTDKLGPAWTALTTGKAPSNGSPTGASTFSASGSSAGSTTASSTTTVPPISGGNWLSNELQNGFGLWKGLG